MKKKFTHLVVKLLVWIFTKQNLAIEERAVILNSLLNKLAMLPLRSIISSNENGSLIVHGKILEPHEQNLLHESAKQLMDNRAFRLIQDEILYIAHSYAINGTINFEQLYSSKMAVWWGQNENRLLHLLVTGVDEAPKN